MTHSLHLRHSRPDTVVYLISPRLTEVSLRLEIWQRYYVYLLEFSRQSQCMIGISQSFKDPVHVRWKKNEKNLHQQSRTRRSLMWNTFLIFGRKLFYFKKTHLKIEISNSVIQACPPFFSINDISILKFSLYRFRGWRKRVETLQNNTSVKL